MSIVSIDKHSPLRYSDDAASALELDSLIPKGKFWSRARCAETDPEAFYPEKGESAKAAKAVCDRDGGCPVKKECLEWALDNNEHFGVWGGKSEHERRKILAERTAGYTESQSTAA